MAVESVSNPPPQQYVAPQPKPKAVVPASPPVNTVSAALQEAAETATQTAQEARQGDHQAQRLLQKQAGAHHAHAQEASTSRPAGAKGSIINTKA